MIIENDNSISELSSPALTSRPVHRSDCVHAFKLAFVHDELLAVFQMRDRIERYGVASLDQNAFRVRADRLSEDDLLKHLQQRNDAQMFIL